MSLAILFQRRADRLKITFHSKLHGMAIGDGDRRQQNTDEQHNNANHHQHLDEGEPRQTVRGEP